MSRFSDSTIPAEKNPRPFQRLRLLVANTAFDPVSPENTALNGEEIDTAFLNPESNVANGLIPIEEDCMETELSSSSWSDRSRNTLLRIETAEP
jgi:hypothetical protein